MSDDKLLDKKISRRTVIKAAAAAGALQLTGPFIISARGEEPVKIGLDNPLTGTYAAVGKNEEIGATLAVEQINAKGGILGRPVAAALRGLDQRRRRHRGAEGAQADRPRQGATSCSAT